MQTPSVQVPDTLTRRVGQGHCRCPQACPDRAYLSSLLAPPGADADVLLVRPAARALSMGRMRQREEGRRVEFIEYRQIERHIVMPHTDPYVVVVAPVLSFWHHPFLRRWAIWLRRLGYTGWLPFLGRRDVLYGIP